MRTQLCRAAVVVSSLLVAACSTPPIEHDVSITFGRAGEQVAVQAETRFATLPRTRAAEERVEAARAAAIAGIDPWSVRFARLTPEKETVTFEKTRGVLNRVTRIVRIREAELQQVFADTSVTVSLIEGDGWRELSFYGGVSGRASREQQRRFEEELATWSRDVARYLEAVHYLYRYLDEAPHRARDLFAYVIDEKQTEGVLSDDELALLDAVAEPMERIARRIDQQDESPETLGELADLVSNPFPARISIHVPGEVLQREGFAGGRDLTIEPVDVLASIATLEGRWVSPDPLALLLRDDKPKSEDLARQRRSSTALVGTADVRDALRNAMKLPPRFVVRWHE